MAAVLRPTSIARSTTPTRPRTDTAGAIRVMLVDDSLTVRTVFARMIADDEKLVVVAQAQTAEKAITELRNTKVDVILLDLEMPGMGGLEALPTILELADTAQVLVVSSLTEDGAEATLKALSIGAADTMLKPRPGGFNDDYRATLLAKIRALGDKSKIADPRSAQGYVQEQAAEAKRPHVVAIGASTGGIHALNLFLRKLPASFDLPIVITQHLPDSFIPVFARQMEAAAGRAAILAEDGTRLERGIIVIAPGHGHIVARRVGRDVFTSLAHHTVPTGCCPSVDPMFESLSEAYDGHVAGVLLSGMGRDGTQGALQIAAAGGMLFAQDEASSAVWGMPRTVAERGIATAVLCPERLAEEVVAAAGVAAWS